MHAGASSVSKRKPVLITLDEDPVLRRPSAVSFNVSPPIENFAGMQESLARYEPVTRPPCISISAFFIKGIGDAPTER